MKKIFILFAFIFSMMLFNSNVLAYDEYEIGDKVIYNNEIYYVIENSDSNTDYVTLLKYKPLTIDELYKYGRDENDYLFINEYSINSFDPEKVVYEYSDGTGGIAYYTSETCSKEYFWNGSVLIKESYITSECTTNYDDSDIKKVLNNWANDKFKNNELVEVNGYKARLITIEELSNNLGYGSSDNPKAFAYFVDYNYWTMSASDDYNIGVVLGKKNSPAYKIVNDSYAVRPVIYLSKNAIGDSDVESSVCKTEKIIKYKMYKIGDEVEYKGEKYYVIEKSNKNQSYVTLLKSNPLTQSQIDSYSNLEYDNNTMISSTYYTSLTCYKSDDRLGKGDCKVDYSSSNVKALVDKWISIKFNDEDLVNVDGYKARLMTEEELKSINLSWLKDYSYWLMNGRLYYKDYNTIRTTDIGVWQNYLIRPVINLSKDKIDDQEEFQIGDIVTYNNDNYYVIEDSDASKNYVVLLKEIPLRFNDINNGEIGNFLYYKGDTCSSSDQTGCTSNYDESSIKVLVNNWASNELNDNDLVEVAGYKARLIMLEELRDNLGYEPGAVISASYYRLTDYVPSWVYDNSYSYWTMSGYEDKNEYVYKVSNNGFIYTELAYNNSAVRPVINLDKCAIDGGCWEEDTCVDDNNLVNAENETVKVENTLNTISTVILIVSIVLIVGGLSILLFNYNKSKKEKTSIKK